MSHECVIDCGIQALVEWVDLSAERLVCLDQEQGHETLQTCGNYPMGGDFAKFGFDLVLDQDLEVYQRVKVPAERTWRICRNVIINDGFLCVEGEIIIGEE